MAVPNNTIRDEREAKKLTLDEVAAKAGISWSTMCRIERNSVKTTQEEVDLVMSAIQSLPASDRKRPTGRPFDDKEKQAAVERARLAGTSVAKIITGSAEGTIARPAEAKAAPKAATAKKPAAKKATKPVAPSKNPAKRAAAAKKPATSRSRSGSRSRARR